MVSSRNSKSSISALTGSRVWALVLAASLLTAPKLCQAVDDARPESWKLDLDLHAWVPEHEARLTTGDELTIGIGDVLDEFDMTLQAGFKARKGRLRLFGDVAYVKLTADDVGSVTVPAGRIGLPVTVAATSYEEKGWIVNAGVGYNLVDEERWTLDVFGGARYLWIDLEIGLGVSTRLLASERRLADSSGHLNGIVAASGVILLNDRWYARYYADIGTGDTDSTWLAQGVVAYRFDSFDAYAGWRHTKWNGVDSDVIDDITLSGPILGVRFKF